MCLCVLETSMLFHCHRNEILKPQLILTCWIPCSLFPKAGKEVYWHIWSIVPICIYLRCSRDTSIFILRRLCSPKMLIISFTNRTNQQHIPVVMREESCDNPNSTCWKCVVLRWCLSWCFEEQPTWGRLLDSAWDMQPRLILEFSRPSLWVYFGASWGSSSIKL